jgi:carbohydrate diacid regulator
MVAPGQVADLAATFVERAGEVFAHITVLDEQGRVIARSSPSESTGAAGAELSIEPLRVPVRLGAETVEVLVTDSVNGETMSPHLARVMVRLLVNQTLMLSRLPNLHELKSTFINTLLRGSITHAGEVLREGELLGMDLSIPRAVILIDASSYVLAADSPGFRDKREARIRHRAQMVIAGIVNFFSLPTDTICAYIGNGEVAVLKASSSLDLAPWLDGATAAGGDQSSWANLTALKRAGEGLLSRLRADMRADISIGIGRYHPGVEGLAHSYRDALAALTLGLQLEGPNRLYCLDTLGTAAFVGVADRRTKIDLATHLLRPLHVEPNLLETVMAFFEEDCCPSATSSRLCIHRNTLTYRLDKVAALTGMDPRRFHDAVQMRLAMLVRSFAAAPGD